MGLTSNLLQLIIMAAYAFFDDRILNFVQYMHVFRLVTEIIKKRIRVPVEHVQTSTYTDTNEFKQRNSRLKLRQEVKSSV